MKDATLSCEIEVIPTSGSEASLAFNVRNPGSQPLNVQYFTPFTNFNLTAQADDGEVQLIQPAYETGVQPMMLTIAAGETVRIETPIQLRFDPNIDPSGGNVPTQWTLRHVPAPVLLQVTMQLNGANVEPCKVRFVPKSAK